MDAFLYFLLQTPKYSNRLFVGQAPGPVFLLWCDFARERRLAGLTLVRKDNSAAAEDLSLRCILPLLKNKLPRRFPVLDGVYNAGATAFCIDGEDCSREKAASVFFRVVQSTAFAVPLFEFSGSCFKPVSGIGERLTAEAMVLLKHNAGAF